MHKAIRVIFGVLLLISYNADAQKNISVFFATPQGSFKNVLGVNAGPDSAVRGYQSMKIPTVRVHDYYGPGDYHVYAPGFYDTISKTFNASFNPRDSLQYDFKSTDTKLQHIATNGFTPFFRLGISYPSRASVPTVPPANLSTDPLFTKFASISAQTVRHYTKGWNKGFNYNIPYWEIWNEPNLSLFWSGAGSSPLNYYRMYKSVADSVKAVNPALKVGGPGLAYLGIFLHQPAYYDSLISYCARNSVPMDFYSWHLYECFNPYAIKAYGDTVKQILRKYGFNNAESFITEINPKLEGDTAYNDKPKGAAYAASVLMMTQDSEVDRIFWYRGLQLGKLVKNDTLGAARLAWNGYAFRVFGQLMANCPTRISSPGNELITTHLQTDTTNFMVLSGKSVTGDTVEVMISNLKSAHSTLNVSLKDVTWPAAQSVGVAHARIQSGSELVTTNSGLTNWTGTFTISNAAAPSVHYVRFTRCSIPKPLITRDASGNLISSASSGNQWYKDGVVIPGAQATSYKPTIPGNYTVIASIDGCNSPASDVHVYIPTSILRLENGQYVKLYPNPVTSLCRLEYKLIGVRRLYLKVFDLNGSQMLEMKDVASGSVIPVSGWPAGSYLLKVHHEDGRSIWQTIIVKP